MKSKSVDSLEAVEMLMALEEGLEGPIPKRFPELKPYLVTPFEARCIRGGFSTEVWVFARHRSTVLFSSFESAVFGVGALNAAGEVREALHYSSIGLAARGFLGAVREAA